MRRFVVNLLFFLTACTCFGQSRIAKEIDRATPSSIALAPLHFLASDELMGRSTSRPEIHIAARYISEQFRSFGLKEVDNTTDYFQTFELKFVRPSAIGQFSLNNITYRMGSELLPSGPGNSAHISIDAPVIYVGMGTQAEIEKVDVSGKLVVMDIEMNDTTTFTQGIFAVYRNGKKAMDKGAAAIIGRYDNPKEVHWNGMLRNSKREYLFFEHMSFFPVYFINDRNKSLLTSINAGSKGKLQVNADEVITVFAKNVLGSIEGADPQLKNQFIVLSAHYDHVGIANEPQMENGKLDSIYNGARDNAIGTTALINAARYFVRHPPKRSILFIAYTGEEIGLRGSRYFAEHPAIPLKQIVYNLNIDNASYNDTCRVTVVGLGRTSADADIQKASMAFGLSAMPDATPEQNFFDRSDNLSLAAKGIPAPTFSLGIAKFDETIKNRYHQLSDEVSNMDLNYAMKYIKSYILAAKNIADNPVQPRWKKGDKYEAAWKALYQKSL